MDEFQLPAREDFFVPVEVIYHPDVDRIRRDSSAWLVSSGLLPQADVGHFMQSHQVAELTASIWPFGHYPDLSWGAKILAWGYLIEEQFDSPGQTDPMAAREFIATFTGLLDGKGGSLRSSAGPSPWITSWQECWTHLKEGMSAAWTEQCTRNWRNYLNAYVTETKNRSTSRKMAFDEVLELRKPANGSPMCCDFIERFGRFELPSEIRALALISRYRELGVEAAVFVNDIYSLPREEALNDPHNTVLAFRGQTGNTLQESLRSVLDRCNRTGQELIEVADAICGTREFKALAAGDQENVRTYLRGVQHMVYGYLDWHFLTTRYQGDPHFYTVRG